MRNQDTDFSKKEEDESIMIDAVRKAFHESRIENEKLLMDGKIRYCDYAEIMLGFESELRELGEVF